MASPCLAMKADAPRIEQRNNAARQKTSSRIYSSKAKFLRNELKPQSEKKLTIAVMNGPQIRHASLGALSPGLSKMIPAVTIAPGNMDAIFPA